MSTTTPESNNTVYSKRSAQIKRLRAFRIPVLIGLALLAFETARAPFAAQPTTEPEVAQASEDPQGQPAVIADTLKTPGAINIDATVVTGDAQTSNVGMPAALVDGSGGQDTPQNTTNDEADDPLVDAGVVKRAPSRLNPVAAVLAAGRAKQAIWSGLTQAGSGIEQSFKESVIRASQARKDAGTELADSAYGAGNTPGVAADAASGGIDATGLDELVLINPESSGVEIFFLVDGRVESLLPGQSRSFQNDGAHLVQFHRGGDFGDAEFQLTNGTYEFRINAAGWDLSKTLRK